MRLADLLSIRKELNTKINLGLGASHLQQTLQVSVDIGAGVEEKVKALVKFKTADSIMAEAVFYWTTLSYVDNLIQTLNHALKAAIPVYVFEPFSGLAISKTVMADFPLYQLLLRRKTLGLIVTHLTGVVQGSPKVPNYTRSNDEMRSRIPQATLDRITTEGWTIKVAMGDITEMSQALNFYSSALRELDSAIQAVNFSHIVDDPKVNELKTVYIPEEPVYVVPKVKVAPVMASA